MLRTISLGSLVIWALNLLDQLVRISVIDRQAPPAARKKAPNLNWLGIEHVRDDMHTADRSVIGRARKCARSRLTRYPIESPAIGHTL
jgi:hypothetical protein